MKLSRLLEIPSTECVLEGPEGTEFSAGYTSDLLSDVMAHADAGSVLITIQAHKNSVAVASVSDLPALLICSSRPIPEDMIEAAKQESIAIYRTDLHQYAASVAVHALLTGEQNS